MDGMGWDGWLYRTLRLLRAPYGANNEALKMLPIIYYSGKAQRNPADPP